MTAELVFWEPRTISRHARQVSDVSEVEAVATGLLAAYQEVGDVLPGLTLHKTASDEPLYVAVGSQRWALIYSDANSDQFCTKRDGVAASRSFDVRWKVLTPVPDYGFIPMDVALIGVTRWLAGGVLAPEINWSDQTY